MGQVSKKELEKMLASVKANITKVENGYQQLVGRKIVLEELVKKAEESEKEQEEKKPEQPKPNENKG